MKTTYIILLFLICSINSNAQSEKSLEETKSYIIKMINEHGWKENSTKRRLNAEFDGDLFKVISTSKILGESIENESEYNFANIYKFKGPIKRPGDVARLIIWADYLSNKKANKWKKHDFELWVDNYDVGEQLMIAFRHLNKLLLEKRPAIEKF